MTTITVGRPSSKIITDPTKTTFMWFWITNKCNEFCEHCYAGSGPLGKDSLFTTEQWMQMLLEAKQAGVESVQFIGGEPTAFEGLPQLVRYATSIGLWVEVFTNMVEISEENWSAFQDCNVSLATSFYSAKPEVHDAITRSSGNQPKIIANIQKALSFGLTLRVGLIRTREGQDCEDAALLLKQLGVVNVGCDDVRGVGRGCTLDKRRREDALCGQCGNSKLCVNYLGQVFPCVFSQWLVVGNVRKNSLTDILNGNKIVLVRDELNAKFAARTACTPQCNPMERSCKPARTSAIELCKPYDCRPARCQPQDEPSCNPKMCMPEIMSSTNSTVQQTLVDTVEGCGPRPCKPMGEPCSPSCQPDCSPSGCNPVQPCYPQTVEVLNCEPTCFPKACIPMACEPIKNPPEPTPPPCKPQQNFQVWYLTPRIDTQADDVVSCKPHTCTPGYCVPNYVTQSTNYCNPDIQCQPECVPNCSPQTCSPWENRCNPIRRNNELQVRCEPTCNPVTPDPCMPTNPTCRPSHCYPDEQSCSPDRRFQYYTVPTNCKPLPPRCEPDWPSCNPERVHLAIDESEISEIRNIIFCVPTECWPDACNPKGCPPYDCSPTKRVSAVAIQTVVFCSPGDKCWPDICTPDKQCLPLVPVVDGSLVEANLSSSCLPPCAPECVPNMLCEPTMRCNPITDECWPDKCQPIKGCSPLKPVAEGSVVSNWCNPDADCRPYIPEPCNPGQCTPM